MTTKVGINGFGRIGRLVFRAMADDPEVEVIAVNDLGDKATAAHLLKYGIRNFDIEVTDDGLVVDGKHVTMLSDRDPANLPWGELGVDVVVEATGIFKTGELAQKHLDAGAKKVVITCPAKDEDITIVMGVNDDQYDQHHLERLLHHQLPGSLRQGAAGELRHQARLHEHHSLLHQRPEDPRSSP